MESKLVKVGAAWQKPNCISIQLAEAVSEDTKLVLLKNQYKKDPKHPDYMVFRQNVGMEAEKASQFSEGPRCSKEIETTVSANTDQGKDGRTLFYDGQSTKVSSGSQWGGSIGLNPEEDATEKIKSIVREHNEWLDAIKDADTGVISKIGYTFKNKIILNGKEIKDINSQSLKVFIEAAK